MSLKLRMGLFLLACAVALGGCNRGGDEAKHWDTTTGSPQMRMADRTTLNQQSGMGAQFDAKLLNQGANAKERKATVEVTQLGLNLVSPEQPPTPNNATNGFIEYRVDGGPPQYTDKTQFSIFNLPGGERDIWVRLDDSTRRGLTEYKHLKVQIPGP
jgi:hypothetical protein